MEMKNQGNSCDPTLDFFSESFDPLKALQTEGLLPPNPKARPLDNLNKCRRILPQEVGDSIVHVPIRPPRSQESIAAQERAKARVSLLAEKAAQKARENPILDQIIEKLKSKGGPLGTLSSACEEKQRVRVWTRHSSGVRGQCLGFLKAVDKHFNMVLLDVDEQYTVRVLKPRAIRERIKGSSSGVNVTQASVGKSEEDHNLVEDGPSTMYKNDELSELAAVSSSNIDAAYHMVERLFPKLENRRRHLKQVFLRGESVVMVATHQ